MDRNQPYARGGRSIRGDRGRSGGQGRRGGSQNKISNSGSITDQSSLEQKSSSKDNRTIHRVTTSLVHKLKAPHLSQIGSQLLQNFPLSKTEQLDVDPQSTHTFEASATGARTSWSQFGLPIVPPQVQVKDSRKKLPTWSKMEEITTLIRNNKVVIITGGTGSGKSTQIPQYLLGDQPVRILCTQPRKIAAISIAKRVAEERGEAVGSTVGYQVQLDKAMSFKTALLYCTTGILRIIMNNEEDMSNITHLIIDEVHERESGTDYLLTVLKSRLDLYPNLKIILMSAAVDTEKFSTFFNNCPVLDVPGNAYPVQQLFLDDVLSRTNSVVKPNKNQRRNDDRIDNDLIVSLIQWIDQRKILGAVLVFLPGLEEIKALEQRILEADSAKALTVFQLHSSGETKNQVDVFQPPTEGKRKVVLSTNIAETSVTIEDVVCVIDTGRVKVKSYDVNGVSSLKAQWIPRASAIQRKGRAGRCRDGICFHLFTREMYDTLKEYQIPEIQRIPLLELCLQSKVFAPDEESITSFMKRMPDPPLGCDIQSAIKILQSMDALDSEENLTDLGKHLIQLPVDLKYGKMLLVSTVLGCVDPILTIICSLQEDPFIRPDRRNQSQCASFLTKKEELADGTRSDAMVLLRAFNLWERQTTQWGKNQVATEYSFSSEKMLKVSRLREQVRGHLERIGFGRRKELNRNDERWLAIKCCLVAGLYPQIAIRHFNTGVVSTNNIPSVKLRSQSMIMGVDRGSTGLILKEAIKSFPTPYIAFGEISKYAASDAIVDFNTLATPLLVAVFGGQRRLPKTSVQKVPTSFGETDQTIEDLSGSYSTHNKGFIAHGSPISGPGSISTEDKLVHIETTRDALNKEFTISLASGNNMVVADNKDNADPSVSVSSASTPRGDTIRQGSRSQMRTVRFQLDEFISFEMDSDEADLLFFIRQKYQALFAHRMRVPSIANFSLNGQFQVIDSIFKILAQQEADALLLPPQEIVFFRSDANQYTTMENPGEPSRRPRKDDKPRRDEPLLSSPKRMKMDEV